MHTNDCPFALRCLLGNAPQLIRVAVVQYRVEPNLFGEPVGNETDARLQLFGQLPNQDALVFQQQSLTTYCEDSGQLGE
ncbi:hypothetical protein D9M69_719880 [compost metagenome]